MSHCTKRHRLSRSTIGATAALMKYQWFWCEMTTARGFVATRPQAKGPERVLIEAAGADVRLILPQWWIPRPRADVDHDVRAVGITTRRMHTAYL